MLWKDSPGGSDNKKIRLQCRRPWFDPWVEKIPIPVFLPGESPWTEELGRLESMVSKESDMTTKHSTAHMLWKKEMNLYLFC